MLHNVGLPHLWSTACTIPTCAPQISPRAPHRLTRSVTEGECSRLVVSYHAELCARSRCCDKCCSTCRSCTQRYLCSYWTESPFLTWTFHSCTGKGSSRSCTNSCSSYELSGEFFECISELMISTSDAIVTAAAPSPISSVHLHAPLATLSHSVSPTQLTPLSKIRPIIKTLARTNPGLRLSKTITL